MNYKQFSKTRMIDGKLSMLYLDVVRFLFIRSKGSLANGGRTLQITFHLIL